MAERGAVLGNMIIQMDLDNMGFIKSLASAQRATKQAMKEMQASMGVVKRYGSDIDKLEQQEKSLGRVLKTMSAEQEQLNKKYQEAVKASGANSQQAQRYATKINDLTAKQAKYGTLLDDTKKKLVTARNSTESLTKSLDQQRRSTELDAQKLRAMGKESQAAKVEQKGLSKELSLTTQILNKEKVSLSQITRAYGANSSAVSEQKLKVKELELAQTQLQNRQKTLNSSFSKAKNNVLGFNKSISNLHLGIATLGFGMVAKSSLEFNDQIQGMAALLNDGTISAAQLQKRLNVLGNASMKWSNQYGVATSSINEGMEEIIKKGYSYEQTLGAMPSILDATKASGDDFNTVMSTSTSILEQFGLKVDSTKGTLKNTQRVTDSLTYVANKTASGFSDMGTAMEYVGPVSHGLNISLEQTAAAIGLMSNNGIEGEKAGTALRGMLTRLLKPSKQNVEGFDALGISFRAFQNGSLTLPDLLDKIKKNTEDLTDSQRTALIAQAFGTEAQTGVNILVEQGADALVKLTKETRKANGYTKEIAKTMNDTAAANVHKFIESIKNLGTMMAATLLPAINPIVKSFTSFFKVLSDSPGLLKAIVVSLTSFIGVVLALKTVVGTFNLVQGAMTAFKNPTTLVVLGIVALIAAFTLAYTKIKPFRDFINNIGKSIGDFAIKVKTVASSVISMFKGNWAEGASPLQGILSDDMIQKIILGVTKVQEVFAKMKDFVVNIFNAYLRPAINAISAFIMQKIQVLKVFWDQNGAMILQAFSNIFKGIWFVTKPILMAILQIFKFVFPLILEIIKTVWANIKGAISGALNVIMGVIKIFAGLFTGNWSKMWEGIKQVFFGAIQFIWNFINLMLFGKIFKGAKLLASGFKGIIVRMWSAIKGFFTRGATNAALSVLNMVGKVLNFGRKLASGFKNVMSALWSGVKSLFRNGVSGSIKFVASLPGRMIKLGLNIKNGFVKGISAMWSGVKSIFSRMVNYVKDMPHKMADGVRKAGGALKKAFVSIWNGVLRGVGKPVNAVIGGVNWVLERFGVSDKKQIKPWKIPQYAKGTDAHPGGLAMVNDGSGKEMVVDPHLGSFVPQGRNVILPLSPGAQVIPSKTTRMMYEKGIIPKYKFGIGSIKDGINDLWKGTKNIASKAKDKAFDVWEYISHPSKLVSKVISNFVDFEGLGGITLKIGKGMVNSLKGAMGSFFKKESESSGAEPPGSGVKRWASTVSRALAMNGLPTSSDYVNAWLRQIQSESGGNPRAVQGNIGDINNRTGDLAKGLVQVIGATFNAYKFPGHGNRLNGLDSLLAGIAYAKSRYGAKGMLGVIGHGHGYANGGIVRNHQIAQIAEKNRPEAVIPLHPSKRSRALELMSQVNSIIGVKKISSNAGNANNNGLGELLAATLEQNKLLRQLVAKDTNVYLDPDKMERKTSNMQGVRWSRDNYSDGGAPA